MEEPRGQEGSQRLNLQQMPARHRPLIPVLGGFALGVVLDGALAPRPWFWLVLGVAMALPVLWGLRRGLRQWGNWFLALLVLVPLGGLRHAVGFRQKPPWHLKGPPR